MYRVEVAICTTKNLARFVSAVIRERPIIWNLLGNICDTITRNARSCCHATNISLANFIATYCITKALIALLIRFFIQK